MDGPFLGNGDFDLRVFCQAGFWRLFICLAIVQSFWVIVDINSLLPQARSGRTKIDPIRVTPLRCILGQRARPLTLSRVSTEKRIKMTKLIYLSYKKTSSASSKTGFKSTTVFFPVSHPPVSPGLMRSVSLTLRTSGLCVWP